MKSSGDKAVDHHWTLIYAHSLFTLCYQLSLVLLLHMLAAAHENAPICR